jgi:hypothetical protein
MCVFEPSSFKCKPIHIRGIHVRASVRAYGVDQAVAHTAPVYVTTGGGFEKWSAVPEIARRMIAKLAEFDSLEADSTLELEAWSVGEPLTRMVAEQHAAIQERVDDARLVYMRMLDVN